MKYTYEASEWAQLVRKKLIDRNMTIRELAEGVGYNRSYTNNLLCGIFRSNKAEARICDYLGIQVEAKTA